MNLPDVLQELGASTQGLVTLSALDRAGVTRGRISRAVAAGQVIRLERRMYAVTALPSLPRFLVTPSGVNPAYVAHVRAALLVLGPRATASTRTAAVLRGWNLLSEPVARVEVAVPNGGAVRSTPRVSGSGAGTSGPGGSAPMALDRVIRQRRRLKREQLVVLPGTDPMWVTSSLQTAVDCILAVDLTSAVVLCDSALRAKAVTLDELEGAVTVLSARAAWKLLRVVELVDARSGSVPESVLRVTLTLAGVTGWEIQVTIRDHDGRYVLRVDFCFALARLIVEVDGQAHHLDAIRDASHNRRLAVLGWRVLRFPAADVLARTQQVVDEIVAALRASSVAA